MLPKGTVTFLFTDIEGSTRLFQQAPSAMDSALERHHEILRDAIESHSGHVFQIVGDAFCAAFARPIDAVNATVASQRGLRDEPWIGIHELRVRMGIHTGETRMHEETYASSLTLVTVQRVMSAGHGGQTLLADSTAALVREELPDGVTLRNMGPHRLRGLSGPRDARRAAAKRCADCRESLKVYDECLRLTRECDGELTYGVTLPNAIEALLASGEVDRARALVENSEYELPGPARVIRTDELVRLRGLVEVVAGNFGAADAPIQAAISWLEKNDANLELARTLFIRAHLNDGLDRPAAAESDRLRGPGSRSRVSTSRRLSRPTAAG